MNPGNFPDTKSTGPVDRVPADGEQTGQDQPHTQNRGTRGESTIDAIDDAESMSDPQAERDYDDAQTAQGRGFATHPSERNKHNTVGETAAQAGNLDRLTFDSNNQGITNHAASIEAEGQKKVTDARPDAQESINQHLNK